MDRMDQLLIKDALNSHKDAQLKRMRKAARYDDAALKQMINAQAMRTVKAINALLLNIQVGALDA